MNWANPKALYLLLMIPVLILFIFFIKKRRDSILSNFCDSSMFTFHSTGFSNFYYSIKVFLLIIVLSLTIIAFARPQWDREVRIVDQHGQDVVFVIDVSKSMDADDISPTRLERAKTHINLFLDELRGDRVAVVAFAGKSTVMCPLTTDYAAVKMIVSGLNSDTITSYGTNIASALLRASELFNRDSNAKTIILLSDGEDLEEEGIKIAREIAKDGIVVYNIGIGSPEGTPLIFKNALGQKEYAKDDKGNIVITRLDVQTLMTISSVTGGKFYMISPNYSEIYEVLKQIDSNEKSKYSSRQFFRYKERYHYFVLLALILFIFEGFVFFKNKEYVQ